MSRPTVLITEPIAPASLAWLGERADTRVLDTPAPTPEQLASANALIVRTYTKVDEAMLAQAPNLRVVARAGVGLDNIDLDACRARNIPVVYTPEANAQAVVEYVTAMMLSTLRPIRTLECTARSARMDRGCAPASRPTQSSEAPQGCIHRARAHQLAVSPVSPRRHRHAGSPPLHRYPRPSTEPNRCGAQPAPTCSPRPRMRCHLRACRWSAPENRHMLDQSFFEALRPEAVLINAARG
ncbi:MAG: hypothetical protein R3B67_04055 [Phycisphaerales bacterium]